MKCEINLSWRIIGCFISEVCFFLKMSEVCLYMSFLSLGCLFGLKCKYCFCDGGVNVKLWKLKGVYAYMEANMQI